MEPDHEYETCPDHEGSPSTEEVLRDRLSSLDAFERGVPAARVLRDIRKLLGIEKE